MNAAPAGVSFSAEQADLAHYGSDWSRVGHASPSVVLFPRTVEEVARLIGWARESGTALIPSGGRTGLSGGAAATGGEAIVSLERMVRIVAVDVHDRTVSVEAGVTTQAVQDAAREHGLFYPVDFASRGSSQIGGNVATNAGGIRVLRYGMTRDWVAGLKVVTGTGAVLDLNRGLVKNATGYDFRHLFIGSEGTLGIIVEVTLQLTAPPPPQQVMLLALAGAADLMLVFDALRTRVTLSAFECFSDRAFAHVIAAGARRPFKSDAPMYALAEFDTDETAAIAAFEAVSTQGHVLDGIIARSEAQAAELWRLREGITECLSRWRPYKNDISVRVADVPAFLEEAGALFSKRYPGFDVVWFGHVGDGNLHVSVLPPAGLPYEEFTAACEAVTGELGALLQRFGGSVSAEHGIGLLKKPYLHYSRSPVEIDLMRQVKRVFDPAGILNPGKIFDPG